MFRLCFSVIQEEITVQETNSKVFNTSTINALSRKVSDPIKKTGTPQAACQTLPISLTLRRTPRCAVRTHATTQAPHTPMRPTLRTSTYT